MRALAIALILCASCATITTPPGATTAQKLQDDIAAAKQIGVDVVTECGKDFSPVLPLLVQALSTGGNAAGIAVELIAAAPAVYGDVQGVICAIRVIQADMKKLSPKKAAQIDAAADDLVAQIKYAP